MKRNNFKKLLIIIIFFICIPSFFGINIYDNLLSKNKELRISALKTILKTKPLPEDNDTLDALTFLLMYENNLEVTMLLLDYFEERKSKNDFFYLIDYLPLAIERDAIEKTIKILHNIHPPTLRRELSNLALKRGRQDLFFSYLEFLKSQNKNCPQNEKFLKWLDETLKQKTIQEYLFQLNKNQFIHYYEISNFCGNPLKYNNIEKYYNAFKRDNYPEDKSEMEDLLFEWGEKVPPKNKYILLKKVLKNNSNLFLEVSLSEKKKLSKEIRYTIYQYASGTNPDLNFENKTKIKKLIENETDSLNLYLLSKMGILNQSEFLLVIQNQCINRYKKNKKTSDSCYLVILHQKPELAKKIFWDSNEEDKNYIIKQFLSMMLEQKIFQTQDFYRQILNQKNPDFTLKFLYHISTEELWKHKEMLYVYIDAHPSQEVKALAHSRFMEKSELCHFYIQNRYPLDSKISFCDSYYIKNKDSNSFYSADDKD